MVFDTTLGNKLNANSAAGVLVKEVRPVGPFVFELGEKETESGGRETRRFPVARAT